MKKLIKKAGNPIASKFAISNETRFTFLTSDNRQVITPVSCRTYLAEVIWSYKTKGELEDTNYDNEKLVMRKTKLAISFKNYTELDNFKKNMYFLHEYETKYSLDKTHVQKTTDPLTLVVYGDKRWMKVWAITLYSFLLKMLSFKNNTSDDYSEQSMMRSFKKEETHLLRAIQINYKEQYQESSHHVHCDGFYSLCKNKDEHLNKKIFSL